MPKSIDEEKLRLPKGWPHLAKRAVLHAVSMASAAFVFHLERWANALAPRARALAEGVEPTNNAAERALRPAVLWRKGSFGSASERGSRFVERMLTVAATCRQQGRSVLEYLVAACEAHARGEPAPSLLPQAHDQRLAAAA